MHLCRVNHSPLAFSEPQRLSLSSLSVFHIYSATSDHDAPLVIVFETQYGKGSH